MHSSARRDMIFRWLARANLISRSRMGCSLSFGPTDRRTDGRAARQRAELWPRLGRKCKRFHFQAANSRLICEEFRVSDCAPTLSDLYRADFEPTLARAAEIQTAAAAAANFGRRRPDGAVAGARESMSIITSALVVGASRASESELVVVAVARRALGCDKFLPRANKLDAALTSLGLSSASASAPAATAAARSDPMRSVASAGSRVLVLADERRAQQES